MNFLMLSYIFLLRTALMMVAKLSSKEDHICRFFRHVRSGVPMAIPMSDV